MRNLLESTAQRAITYLEGLDIRAVAPPPGAIAALRELEEPLPARPTPPEQVVELLDRVASPATMAMAGPRFFGFVIGGSVPASLAANWLVQAWDQNSALANVTPATARVEAIALRWLLDLLGLPATSAGAFVTGGTMANFTSLAAARHAVLVRDGAALQAAMAITAEYLPSASAARNPCDYTPELSRRARGVEVWAALRSLGRSGFEDMINGCVAHAKRFAEGLRAAGFEILNDVVLNQVLVSFGDPERTNRVTTAVQQDGTCWCGPTVWQGRSAMRISVSSWATTTADVEKSLAAIIRVARATP